MKSILTILFALCLPVTVLSQVLINSPGPAGAYSQNFNSVTFLSSADYSLTDNAAANLGWYAFRTTGNAVPNVFDAETGSDNTGEFNNYGPAGNLERALGSVASAGTDTLFYGLRIQNNTGILCRSIRVTFTGEQWRDANNTPQTLDFSYQVSAGPITSLTTGTFTDFDALDFVSPTNANSGAIDGNAVANRTLRDQAIFVDIPIGGEIMLRWADANNVGNDHGLSIDDVTVTLFVPSAAGVSVSGRAVTPDGAGIMGAVIRLSGGALTEPMTAITSPFGYFSLEDVPSGATYIIEINSKRYAFEDPTRTITVADNVTDVEFVASPPK